MNIYDLQAKCEQLKDRAALAYRAQLDRAARRFRALQATLSAERADHEKTKRERDLALAICAGLSRELEARKRARH